MTKGVPFVPLVKVTGGADGPGRMQAVVDEDGEPVWQGGDIDPQWFAISAVGWFAGHVSSTTTHNGIHGWAYVTGARSVVVASDFAKGARYRAVGVPSLSNMAYMATANRVSKSRARKETAGQFLAGQMRFPWVGQIVWAPPSMRRKSQGQVRLVGTHRSVFGDEESVALCFRLTNAAEVVPFVSLVVDRIRADRLGYERTTPEQRGALEAVPHPSTVNSPSSDTLASIRLPGSWIITSGSAFLGTISAMSSEIPA